MNVPNVGRAMGGNLATAAGIIPGVDRRLVLAAVAVLVALAGIVAVVAEGGDEDGGDRAGPPSGPSATTTTSTTVPGQPPPVDHLSGFVPAPLEWEGCGGDFQCADLQVPLDWADPAGPTITIAVSRLPASGDEPLGALAVNPGGPGASGNGFIRADPFAGELRERYDILSWDPRGVGGSTRLGCEGEAVDAFLVLDAEPDDEAEAQALDAAAQAVAAACGAGPGAALLPHIGTGQVARDLEAIRRAYGGPMAFYGLSYGTAIALEHMELFPGALTRVVLDGVVDPTLTLGDVLKNQARAFEAALEAMFEACDGNEHCPEGGAEAVYDELAVLLEEHPLPTGDEQVGPSELATAAIYAAYDRSAWEFLWAGLTAADAGDGSILKAMSDNYRSLGSFDVYQAVWCVDSVNPVGAEGWSTLVAETTALAPRLGATIANEMRPCAHWPVPPTPVTGPVTAEGSGPVLVIGTTHDPATPLHQAEAVAAMLADGHLLVREGFDHTAYSYSGCVRDAAARFLIDGVLPDDGARCDG